MSGIEKRRVRFASISGLGREDLPLAAEIWYEDVVRQVWSSRDVIKMALLLTRYMSEPNEELLYVGYIERTFNMDVRSTLDTLRQMEMFGAIEAFSIKDNMLHASLCLSLMQRVKTMEMRARIMELSGASSMAAFLGNEAPDRWAPPSVQLPDNIDEAPDRPPPDEDRSLLVRSLLVTLTDEAAARAE